MTNEKGNRKIPKAGAETEKKWGPEREERDHLSSFSTRNQPKYFERDYLLPRPTRIYGGFCSCSLPASSLGLVSEHSVPIFTALTSDAPHPRPQESAPSYRLGRLSSAIVSDQASTLRSLLPLPNDWRGFSFSICLYSMENMTAARGSLF